MNLLFENLPRLVGNLDAVPWSRLFSVLHACRELHYRNLELLTGVSDYVGSMVDIWTSKQVLQQTCTCDIKLFILDIFVKLLVFCVFVAFPLSRCSSSCLCLRASTSVLRL